MAAHILNKHRWERVAGRMMRIVDYLAHGKDRRFSTFKCWCGAHVGGEAGDHWRNVPTFHNHLAERGGIHAHLLEIGLGLLP